MRTPICKVCLRSNIICRVCKEVIEELGMSKKEIGLLRELNRLAESIKALEEVEVKRVMSDGKIIIIVKKGQAARFIGKDGINIRKLKRFLRKSIKVVEADTDVRTFVQGMVFPTPVLGVNVIYGKDERYVIRIPKSEEKSLPIPPDEIVNVCESFFKKGFEVRFELVW